MGLFQSIDQVMTIKTHTESSKTELSSRGKRPFKVWRFFYVQFDFNFTSNSISILRPIRPQFYVQFDLNFTSNLISIFLWSDVCISQSKAANGTPPFVCGISLPPKLFEFLFRGGRKVLDGAVPHGADE